MYYLTKQILMTFDKQYLKTLKTIKDLYHAYDCVFAPCMADGPGDMLALMDTVTRDRVVNELYDYLKIWRKWENE